jgi:tyrosine-protein kinase Etk/Wzc
MDQIQQLKKTFEINEVDFKEILQHLRAGKHIILSALFIAFFVSSIIAFFRLPVYQPAVLLQVDNQNNATNGIFSSGMNQAASISPFSSTASPAQIEMTLMQSSYILQPVINSLALNVTVTPKYFPIVGHYFAARYQGIMPASAKLGLRSYAWGGEHLDVGAFNTPPDYFKKDFLFRVKDATHYNLYYHGDLILQGEVGLAAVSHDGKFSLIIRQMLARPGTEFYLRRYSNVSTLQNLQKSISITELSPPNTDSANDTGIIQLSLISASPDAASKILNMVANITTQASGTQKLQQNLRLLNFIKQEIPLAQQNLIDAESRLNQYQAQNELLDLNDQSKSLLNDMSVIDDQAVATELNKAQLLQIYTPENPMIQNIQSELDALKEQKQKFNAALAHLPAKYQKVIDLMRDVKVYNILFTQLMTRSQQMEITDAGLGSDLSILQLATPPDQPLPSRALINIFASTLLGAILGCLFVLGRHFLSGGINDPYLIERDFGIRTIGIVPFSLLQAKNKKLFDQGEIKSLPVLSKIDNHDPSIESLRSLRTSLFMMLAKKSGKCVTISGVIPEIGKSFISVNLAVILAEAGKKVLLIDGDIRKGYLYQYFKKPIAPGLSEFLNGVANLEKTIHATEFAQLDFMSCGLHSNNPGDLLLKEDLGQLLKSLEQAYDLIIIDTPPMLAVSDASLFAQYCALNFIVMAAGKIQKHELETTIKQFYSHGIQIDGNIFNFTNKNIQAASKFGYQRYYQRYARK